MQSASATESASDIDVQTAHTPVESSHKTTKKSSGKRTAVSAGKYSPQYAPLGQICHHSIKLIETGSPVSKKLKAECEAASEELHFGLLVPFKNHEDGLKAFS